MPGMLLLGTVIDAIQFKTFSTKTTFLISAVYLGLCAVAMILMVLPMRSRKGVRGFFQLAAPFVQQFTIGALLSTSLLFYWFSGSLSASWPLVLVVALLMVSNEVLRGYFLLPTVQMTVFAFVTFSLAATGFAYALNSLSPIVFVLGGMASFLATVAFLVVFIRAGGLGHLRRPLWFVTIGVFAAMNIGYFLNVIPPIPLSLRDAGMYTNVALVDGEYVLDGEEESWLASLIPGQVVHITPGERLYAFTTIAAPAELSTTIVHRWERLDDETGWTTVSTLPFGLSGGRAEGFRGYSFKSSLSEGKWRVTVETERGQVLGRIPFRVEFIAP